MATKASFRSLFTFTAKQDLLAFVFALLLTGVSGAAKPTIAIFIGKIFDHLGRYQVGESTSSQLLGGAKTWCLAITGLGVGLAFINGLFFGHWLLFGEKQARSVRKKLFDGILMKEIDWFDSRSDGIVSLLIRIQTQIRELQSGTSQSLGFFFEDIATVIAGVSIAFYNSWKLTLVILATIPAIMIAVRLASRARSGLGNAIEDQKLKLGNASKLGSNAISAIDTVKAFNGENYEVEQYQNAITSQVKPYLDQAFINALQIGISGFGTTAMFGISFWYALNLVQHGLNGGKVVTAIYSCVMAAQAAEAILPHWLILARGMSAGVTLKNIMEEIKDGRKPASINAALKPSTCLGEIEFRKTTFAYPTSPGQLALDEVDFFFAAKQTTFVIGKSGSGKSTLGNLLVKFYEPSSGDIFLDGFPIHALDTEWLRNKITLVQQQSTLFDETLFRNIAFGRRSHSLVSKADILLASQTAVLAETINDLPEGLDTMVGATGNSMSGGQKQRVAIARARLRDSPVLVLDEATSALDPESRSLVMEAIREWRRDMTTIIITHDISQIMNDDYVYVLEGGKIVQEGSRILIEHQGAFRNFVSQSQTDPENPFNDSVEVVRRRSAAVTYSESISSVAGEISDPHASNSEGYTSRLLGMSQMGHTGLQTGLNTTGRLSLGVGMGAPYANILRSQDAWEPMEEYFSDPVISLRMPSYLKPPTDSGTFSTRSLHQYHQSISRQNLPKQSRDDFGLMELQGRATQESHRENSRLGRSSQSRKRVPGAPNVKTVESKQDLQSPSQRKKSKQKHVANLKQILATVPATLTAKTRLYCILGLLFCAISAACTPAFAFTFSGLLSTLNLLDKKEQTAEGRKWALLIIAIAAIDGLTRFLFHYLAEYVAVTWVANLRVEAFRRILSQPKSWFSKPSSTTEKLSECLDRNAEEMRNIVGRFLGLVCYAGFMMVVAIIWALAVCWKLTLVGLSAVPVIYILSRAFEAASSKWEGRLNSAASHSGAVFNETFSNIRVVRALTLEKYFKEKLRHAANRTYRVGQRRAVFTGFFFGINDCTTQLVTALVLYYGCIIAAYSSHQWSVPEILTVTVLLLFSATSAAGAISLIPQIGQARATANYMLYLSNLPRNASHEARGTNQINSLFPVELTQLKFQYPAIKDQPAIQVLQGINMTFEAGTSTAIVGPSGCGKSTIASLLLALYPPLEPLHPRTPAISFASNSIAKLSTRSLRGQMAIVPQQPVLFPTTVARNISYGLGEDSPLNTLVNITCAAQAAGIHETIMSLPAGYETLIGDGGQGLSGGQAQRVAIARALLRRPKLLILDEATSALDAESARGIRDLIVGLVKSGKEENMNGGVGMAVVVVTHATEMMRIVDKIVMLEAGHVVEEGGFDELMAKGGRFARLIGGGQRIF